MADSRISGQKNFSLREYRTFDFEVTDITPPAGLTTFSLPHGLPSINKVFAIGSMFSVEDPDERTSLPSWGSIFADGSFDSYFSVMVDDNNVNLVVYSKGSPGFEIFENVKVTLYTLV